MAFRSGAWLVMGCCLAAALLPTPALARRRFYRARFETEALQLQRPGEVEIDAQLGGFYGDGPDHSRLSAPDAEIDVGILPWLELDLDFAFGATQLASRRARFAADPLWLSARTDLLNWRDRASDANFGIGLQAGPRLPSVHTPRGVGGAALLLIGGGTRALHLVANAGALLDHGQAPAIVYGVDFEYELGPRWSLLGDVAAAHYFSSDPGQLLIDFGAAYKPSAHLSLSLLAIGGPLVRGDRAGAVFGVSYAFQAWGRPEDPSSGGGHPVPIDQP